ncbi:MAG: 50S ribosomal protein L31e [Candidatus Woesearchaeota archaeon]
MASANEQIMNVPLRKEFLKAPRWNRTKKAVIALRQYIAKKTRVEPKNVKIGLFVNELMWERGIQKPPHHVLVKVLKENDVVYVEHPDYFDDFYKMMKKEKEEKETKQEEKEVQKVEKSEEVEQTEELDEDKKE